MTVRDEISRKVAKIQKTPFRAKAQKLHVIPAQAGIQPETNALLDKICHRYSEFCIFVRGETFNRPEIHFGLDSRLRGNDVKFLRLCVFARDRLYICQTKSKPNYQPHVPG